MENEIISLRETLKGYTNNFGELNDIDSKLTSEQRDSSIPYSNNIHNNILYLSVDRNHTQDVDVDQSKDVNKLSDHLALLQNQLENKIKEYEKEKLSWYEEKEELTMKMNQIFKETWNEREATLIQYKKQLLEKEDIINELKDLLHM